MKVILYAGKVFDRMTCRLIYKSRPQTTYEAAHKLAEKHVASARYQLVVDTLDTGISIAD